jgi:hypothetical protein
MAAVSNPKLGVSTVPNSRVMGVAVTISTGFTDTMGARLLLLNGSGSSLVDLK